MTNKISNDTRWKISFRNVAKIKPTSLDIAWAAGLYEGEGTCCFCDRKNSLTVNVVQKGEEILFKLREMFGGSITYRGDASVWSISGIRAHAFIMTVYRFLSTRRRDQARFACNKEIAYRIVGK